MTRKLLAATVAVTLGVAALPVHAAPGETDLSGKMYVDLTRIDQGSGRTGDTDDSGVGLDVKRFYLGVDHQLDPVWSLSLTTDFNYVGNDGQTNLYVKKAYVEGRFSDAARLRIGSADTPWIGLVDAWSGFRYVEKSAVDRLKFGNSADWGLHLGGKFGPGQCLDYAVSVVNGAGYKHATRSKGMDVAARIGYQPVDGLIVALGAYSGTRGKETESDNALHTARRTDLMLAWHRDGLRVGAAYFRADNWNTVLAPNTDSASGWSAWASTEVGTNMAVFVRYDQADLSRERDPAASDRYWHTGVQFQVTRGFKLAAVVKHRDAETGVDSERTREIGLWAEVKF